jgi:putative membrane protein
MRAERRRNPWKGLLAGALGGFVGSFAMNQFHSLVLPRAETSSQQNKEDSTVLAGSAISQALFHHELTEQETKIVGPAVHYAFGASMAAVYATLVEWEPVIRAGCGIPFGVVLWLGAHVITVPALGLSEPITRSTAPAEAAEFGAHLVYGAVAEVVRRLVRVYVLP